MKIGDMIEAKQPFNSLAEYVNERKELFDFVKIIRGHDKTNVHAPVKCGKKTMMIIAGHLDQPYPQNLNVCVTGLNRKENAEQASQLKEAGVEWLYIGSDRGIDTSVNQLVTHVNEHGEESLIHMWLDESDYASCKNSMVDKFMKACEKSGIRIDKICNLSASPFDTFHADRLMEEGFVNLTFEPPEQYFGAKDFLDMELIREPEEFYSRSRHGFTSHAVSVIEDFAAKEVTKKAMCVRLVGKGYDEKKGSTYRKGSIYKTFLADEEAHELLRDRYKIVPIFVHQDNKINWKSTARDLATYPEGVKFIYFLCESAGRSTEIYIQPEVWAWHEFRSEKTNANTAIQSVLRCAGYGTPKGDPPILYVDRQHIQFAAGRISPQEYMYGVGSRRKRKLHSMNTVRRDVSNLEWRLVEDISEIPESMKDGGVYNTMRYSATNYAEDCCDLILRGKAAKTNLIEVNGAGPGYEISYEKLCAKYDLLPGQKAIFYREDLETPRTSVSIGVANKSRYS